MRLRYPPRFNISYATFLGSNYDASTTNLTYLIPKSRSEYSSTPVELVLSFFSPITPTSTLRQSIPASYLNVHVKGSFNVDVYVDINGQWVSGDRGSFILWELQQQELGDSDVGLKTWKVKRETELLFSEFRDQAEWGTLHFTAPSVGHDEAYYLNTYLTATGRSSRVWNISTSSSWIFSDWHPSECSGWRLSQYHGRRACLCIRQIFRAQFVFVYIVSEKRKRTLHHCTYSRSSYSVCGFSRTDVHATAMGLLVLYG